MRQVIGKPISGCLCEKLIEDGGARTNREKTIGVGSVPHFVEVRSYI